MPEITAVALTPHFAELLPQLTRLSRTAQILALARAPSNAMPILTLGDLVTERNSKRPVAH
jgi:hypothetical protein